MTKSTSPPAKPATPTVYSRFNLPPRGGLDCSVAPTITKQSFKDECDINRIMSQFAKTGIIAHGNTNNGTYGDIPSIDFRQAMEVVAQAGETFDDLPASTRARFHNDPAQFLEFCEDPENIAEARKLGLADPETPPPDPPIDPPALQEPPEDPQIDP